MTSKINACEVHFNTSPLHFGFMSSIRPIVSILYLESSLLQAECCTFICNHQLEALKLHKKRTEWLLHIMWGLRYMCGIR